MIPYARHSIEPEDIEAVVQTLKSDWLTQGPVVSRFESVLAECVGSKHAVAVANGTAALHIACLSLGLKSGDYLWTSPISFVASANCARYCGANVDFIDIDPATRNISVEKLSVKLAQAKAENRLPKIVIPVHFSGLSCDMAAIYELAQEYQFYIIEDAAHALGATYQGAKVGSCQFSDATIFSFHPAKLIAAGEGGAVLTNSTSMASKLEQFRTHGITRDKNRLQRLEEGDWYYEQQSLGFNYRMSDIHAALGLSQLGRLEKKVKQLQVLVQRYHKLLSNLPLKLPKETSNSLSAWHIYTVELEENLCRASIFQYMRDRGVGVNVHYIPIHLQPDYRELGFDEGDFPVSEAYYKATLTLPLFPGLTEQDQLKVVHCLKEALEQCH